MLMSKVFHNIFLVGILSFDFQRLWSTYRIVLELTSLLFFSYSKFSTPMLSFLFPLSFSFSAFSSIPFSLSSFTFSSFYFCYPDFPCFGLYCFPYLFEHLVIFTYPVFQLISGLWYVNHGIPKITFYFCLPITLISILFLCF